MMVVSWIFRVVELLGVTLSGELPKLLGELKAIAALAGVSEGADSRARRFATN
jgi:hypothetical protein